MVTKNARKSKSRASSKMRIAVEHTFGPYQSTTDAAKAKKQIKAKVAKIVFSPTKLTRGGYVFKGTLRYLKAVNAPLSAVKSHLQTSMPGAKVHVTRG